MYNRRRPQYSQYSQNLRYKSNIALIPPPVYSVRPQFNPRVGYLNIVRNVPRRPAAHRRMYVVNNNLTEGNKQLLIWIFCMFLISSSFWMTGEI
jgi:hypothetical protein